MVGVDGAAVDGAAVAGAAIAGTEAIDRARFPDTPFVRELQLGALEPACFRAAPDRRRYPARRSRPLLRPAGG
jgi:hypothetical protein